MQHSDESGPLPHELLGYDLGYPAWSAALKVCAPGLFQRAGQKIVTVGRRARTMTFAAFRLQDPEVRTAFCTWLR